MRYLAAICLLINAVPAAFSQTGLRFDVATVKPSNPDDPRTIFDPGSNGARFRAIGASLKALIAYAWDKQLNQISGGPKWLDSERFDIEAKQGNDAATPTDWTQRLEMYRQLRAALQSLLADRFHLVVHNEIRQESVYELVLAKGGSKLKDASASAETPVYGMGRGQITTTATPLSRLAILLSGLVGRQVIDKTGLTGRYNITLNYAPDASQRGTSSPDATPPSGPDTPSVFTALQEQLGLKLEPARGPVDVLVIDHAEKPDAN